MTPSDPTAPGASQRHVLRRAARRLAGRRDGADGVDAGRAERVAFQLLALAYRQHPASLAINLVTATGVATQVTEAGSWVWRWLVVVGLMTAARGVLYVAFRRSGVRAAAAAASARRRWQHAHEAGLLVAASLWALLALAALPELSPVSRLVVVFALGGLTAGATGVLAPLRGTAVLYMSILSLPAAIRLLVMGETFTGALAIGFLLVMLVGHHNNRAVLLRSLGLQEDNIGLVHSLRSQNERVQQLNASLERRVVERTRALETMAHHDALTGLSNRRGLLRELGERLDGAGASGTVLLFLDLDRFKQINDGLGHDAGDLVLQRIAARFAAAIPADATIGRWGGDEFVVIAHAAGEGSTDAAALAGALAGSLVDPIDVEGEPLQLAVSIGVAAHPQDGSTATALIRAADLAATEVKRTGRGQIRFYHRTLSESQRRRLELSLGLKSAMTEGSLGVAYQPVVDAADGSVSSLEALLRWRHPVLGTIAPDEFIPIAEESDRIVEVGAWVLRRACLDAMTWTDEAVPPRVAVNVSVRQLLSPGFDRVVATALEGSGLPGDRLEVEVTESVFDPRHTAVTLESLLRLRALGVRVHVDDFGAGYSSLSRLHEFPIDAIKVDRSFTGNLDGAGRAIIEGTIVIARRFGLGVIAEGVETEAQARELCALGVDALQGYWLGVPDLAPRTAGVAPVWRPDASVPS